MKNAKRSAGRRQSAKAPFLFLLLLVTFVFGNVQVRAQLPGVPSISTGSMNAGSLLAEFAKAIKPSSFIDQWAGEKSSWLSSVSKIASSPGMIEGITSLTKFIKPSMFKEAFKPANLLQTASKAKTMADAAGLLKTLEGGLKPEAMVSGWAGKKDAWTSALDLLK